MSLKNVLITLNELVSIRVIKDYAICGGYAAMYYGSPEYTYDVDVLAILSSDEDFHRLYEHFDKKGARTEDVYIFVDDLPVQFLPNISHLHNSAVEEANLIEFDGVYGKYVTVEYLIALFLTSFRDKDKIRIKGLLNIANRDILEDILERFDNDQYPIFTRYKGVLGESNQSS